MLTFQLYGIAYEQGSQRLHIYDHEKGEIKNNFTIASFQS